MTSSASARKARAAGPSQRHWAGGAAEPGGLLARGPGVLREAGRAGFDEVGIGKAGHAANDGPDARRDSHVRAPMWTAPRAVHSVPQHLDTATRG